MGLTITINGIDVNECEYLNPLDNGVYECILGKKQILTYRVCGCNHNCDFKQLKRAEQKFKKIEEKCKEYSTSIDIYDESDILAGEILQIIEDK